jgi:hypothetical protein
LFAWIFFLFFPHPPHHFSNGPSLLTGACSHERWAFLQALNPPRARQNPVCCKSGPPHKTEGLPRRLHIVLHTCPILTLQFIWLSPHVSRRLGLWCTHFCSLAMVLSKAPQITKILITAWYLDCTTPATLPQYVLCF